MDIIKGIIRENCIRLLDSDKVNISELARLTKISPSTIHKWKEGKHAPELPNIERMAEAMGINPLEFLTSSESPLIRELPVSKTLKKMLAIPDSVYEAGEEFGPQDEVWDTVIAVLKDAKSRKDDVQLKATRSQT